MTVLMTDFEIEAEIRRVETEIEKWVRSRDLWGDCGFRNYNDYCDAEPWPDSPVATIFVSDGDFNRVFDGGAGTDELYEEFTSLLERLEYWCERDTGRVYLYSVNSRINTSFQEYFHWQWVCRLLKPDFNDVHHELFELLSEKPEYLNKLSWREFEILIYELLRKQGFGVEGMALADRKVRNVFRPKKDSDGYRTWFWTGRELYSLWDGQAQYFDHCD